MSSSCLLDLLPPEIIRDIGLHLPLVEIPKICQTSKKFNQPIGQNEDFWHLKFVLNYKFDPINDRGSWKELYKNSNKVWTFGNNSNGQLGLDDDQDRTSVSAPTEIEKFRVKEVSGGGRHTVVIDLEKNVWTFGNNEYGQLGLGDNETKRRVSTPTKIPNLKAKQVSVGECHTVIIDLENNVWTFGWNQWEQLGLGINGNRKKPTQIPNIKAHQVSAGGCHTVIIDIENNVWTFGRGESGQLGLGDDENRTSVTRPTKIPNFKARQVSAGGNHTVIIDLEDNVWTCGWNHFGQLGLGDNKHRKKPTQVPNIKALQVSAGGYYTVMIDIGNNVWTFGSNKFGQLGLGDTQDRNVPIKIPNLKAEQVSAGENHTVVIDKEKNVWTFGENEYQLGLGDNEKQYEPTQIQNFKVEKVSAGRFHTIMIGTRIM